MNDSYIGAFFFAVVVGHLTFTQVAAAQLASPFPVLAYPSARMIMNTVCGLLAVL